MESLFTQLAGALLVTAISAGLLPLFERVKYWIAMRSVEKNKSYIHNEYSELSKAISELDADSVKRIEIALDKFTTEIKSVKTKDKSNTQTTRQIMKELNDTSFNLENLKQLDEKVAIVLPIIPLLLNYEITLNLSSNLENVKPAKQAAEILKLEALNSGNAVVENAIREVSP